MATFTGLTSILPMSFVVVYNTTDEVIPPFAVMQLTGIDTSGVHSVAKPTEDNLMRNLVFNWDVPIDPLDFGQGTLTLPALVQFDQTNQTGAKPQLDEIWGVQADSWCIQKDRFGLRILRSVDQNDATQTLTLVDRMQHSLDEIVRITSSTPTNGRYPAKRCVVDAESNTVADGVDIWLLVLAGEAATGYVLATRVGFANGRPVYAANLSSINVSNGTTTTGGIGTLLVPSGPTSPLLWTPGSGSGTISGVAASGTQAGFMTTGAQTIAGDKNFTGAITLGSGSSVPAASITGTLGTSHGGTGATTPVGGYDALSPQGADIAASATTDIGAATGPWVNITGAGAVIAALGVAAAGALRAVQFAGINTLVHNGTSLKLPGNSNITTAAGDVAQFRSEGGGNWVCTDYQVNAAAPWSGGSSATLLENQIGVGDASDLLSGNDDFTFVGGYCYVTVDLEGGFEAEAYGDVATPLAFYRVYRPRGTVASPSDNSTSDYIGGLVASARVTGTKVDIARLLFQYAGTNTAAWEFQSYISSAWTAWLKADASGNLNVPLLTASRILATDSSKNVVTPYSVDTDGTLAANSDSVIPTQKAIKTFVSSSVTGLLEMKGSTDCSANPNYPAGSKGDLYYVTVAGKIGGASGKSVDVGDVYVASADNAGGDEASVGTSWFVLEHNLSGVALTSGNLSQFAATTSAQLRGVLSDENGTGAALFDGATSPTFVTPTLGAASATSVNKVTLTQPATGSTLTIDDGFTLHCTGNVTALSGSSTGANTGDQTIHLSPGGRLTLTSHEPEMTTDVTGATSIYYTPCISDQVPLFDGSQADAVQFTEMTLALDNNSGHTGYHQSGKIFDLFVFNDSGTIRLGTGPAWSSDTSRGSGAGTTELAAVYIGGVWTNAYDITARFGSSSGNTVTVAANRGTYVGSVLMSANGQTEMSILPAAAAGGSNTKCYLWNAFNKVLLRARSSDNTATWNYSTATWRSANGNTSNRITFLTGLPGITVKAEHSNRVSATGGGYMGTCLDNTNAGDNTVAEYGTGITQPRSIASYRPGIGKHFVQATEYTSSGTSTFGTNTAQGLYLEYPG